MAYKEFETGRLGKSIDDYVPGTFIVSIGIYLGRNHTYAKVITKEEYAEKGGHLRPELEKDYRTVYGENSSGMRFFFFPRIFSNGPIIVEKREIIRELEKDLLNTKKELGFFENQ